MHILDWMVLFPCIKAEHTDKDEAKKYAFESLIWKNKKIKIKLEGQLSWGLKFYKNHSGFFFFFWCGWGGVPWLCPRMETLQTPKTLMICHAPTCATRLTLGRTKSKAPPAQLVLGFGIFAISPVLYLWNYTALQSVYICLPVFDYGKAKEQTTVIYSKYPWFMHYKQAKGSLSN